MNTHKSVYVCVHACIFNLKCNGITFKCNGIFDVDLQMLPNSAWFAWFKEVFGTQAAVELTAACCAVFHCRYSI